MIMNAMCDLKQFVVSIGISKKNSFLFAKKYMEHVVLTFDMVAVVVVDINSKFLGFLKEICHILDITFHALARGNHKGLTVERFH